MKKYLIDFYIENNKKKIVNTDKKKIYSTKCTIENDILSFENYRHLLFKRLKNEKDRFFIARVLPYIFAKSFEFCSILRICSYD